MQLEDLIIKESKPALTFDQLKEMLEGVLVAGLEAGGRNFIIKILGYALHEVGVSDDTICEFFIHQGFDPEKEE